MSHRLLNYIVVCEIDYANIDVIKITSGTKAKVTQSIPTIEWKDVPKTPNISSMANPLGWNITKEPIKPKFFTTTLTDADGRHSYLPTLIFSQLLENGLYGQSTVSIATAWESVSIFKYLLCKIHQSHVSKHEKSLTPNIIISNLFETMFLFNMNKRLVEIDIGNKNVMIIEHNRHLDIRNSNGYIQVLISNIGIFNTVKLFAGLITDHRIIIFSDTMNRLYETSIHNKYKTEVMEIIASQCIYIDVDIGSITYSDDCNIPSLSHPSIAELIFILKKENLLRATFILFFVKLFNGYREFLIVLKIFPKSIIKFLKEQYIYCRKLGEDEFFNSLINSMMFDVFITTYAQPYRKKTIFDEIYQDFVSVGLKQNITVDYVRHVALILQKQICKYPEYLMFERVKLEHNLENYSNFPRIETKSIDKLVKDYNESKSVEKSNFSIMEISSHIKFSSYYSKIKSVQTLRVDIIKKFLVQFYAKQGIEAKNSLHNVINLISFEYLRNMIFVSLIEHCDREHCVLDTNRFIILSKLLKAIIEAEEARNHTGILHQVIEISDKYYRKVGDNKCEYIITSLQNYPLWSSYNFWESYFYTFISDRLYDFYMEGGVNVDDGYIELGKKPTKQMKFLDTIVTDSISIKSEENKNNSNNERSNSTASSKCKLENYLNSMKTEYVKNLSLLNILAYIEINTDKIPPKWKKRYENNEDDIIFSYLMIFVQTMVRMLVVELEIKIEDKIKNSSNDPDQDNDNLSEDEVESLDPNDKVVANLIYNFIDNVSSNLLMEMEQPDVIMPPLCMGETTITSEFRCILLSNGQDDSYLPAQGALYSTNLNLIFHGYSIESDIPIYKALPFPLNVKKMNKMVFSELYGKGFETPQKKIIKSAICITSVTSQFMDLCSDTYDSNIESYTQRVTKQVELSGVHMYKKKLTTECEKKIAESTIRHFESIIPMSVLGDGYVLPQIPCKLPISYLHVSTIKSTSVFLNLYAQASVKIYVSPVENDVLWYNLACRLAHMKMEDKLTLWVTYEIGHINSKSCKNMLTILTCDDSMFKTKDYPTTVEDPIFQWAYPTSCKSRFNIASRVKSMAKKLRESVEERLN
ncbi:hypothetical protein A3Q56_00299 [Intoshia linei]|uniref:Uncharacterized protein n=1 Tax=Intoshia linei TaxID=1819745 RepID=A0A177BCL5_9BILA|nr:hypothetical protein A3Q56_00299 [Intoshia linei]